MKRTPEKKEQNEEVYLNNQESKVLEYMKKHGSITSLEAARAFYCLALPQRIYDLRNKGYKIAAKYEVNKKTKVHYVRYTLA